MRIAIMFVLTLVAWTLTDSPLHAQPPAHADSCAACHGAMGISIAAGVPHLASQDADYLRSQLRAFRSGTRQNALMSAIATQLSDGDIDALADFHARLPGPMDGSARSQMLPGLVTTEFPFPDNYDTAFTRYHTTNPGSQVRHYYANDTALNAARAGQPLPDGSFLLVEIFAAIVGDDAEPVHGDDGRFVAGERVGFNAMAREAGWGDSVPELLRNENWRYANFTAERTLNRGANQAACLACHVPLTETSYTFTIEQLTEAARGAD